MKLHCSLTVVDAFHEKVRFRDFVLAREANFAVASSAPDTRDSAMRQATISKLGADKDTKTLRNLHGEDLCDDL